MNTRLLHRIGCPALAAAVWLTSGCAVSLKQRATTLWDARVKADCDIVQQFEYPESPGAQKPEEYIEWCKSQEPFLYKSYTLKGVESAGDFGWATVAYTCSIRGFEDRGERTVETAQKWRRQKGTWYPAPKNFAEEMPDPPSRRDTTAETTLRTRVEASAAARIAGDWATVYEFIDPRDRVDVPLETYESSEGLAEWLKADIQWCEAIGDRARVFVVYQVKLKESRNMPGREIRKIEDWVKIDGQWYRDVKREI